MNQEISDFWANNTKNKITRQKAKKERQVQWFKDYLKSKIANQRKDEYKREMEKATAEKIEKLKRSKML